MIKYLKCFFINLAADGIFSVWNLYVDYAKQEIIPSTVMSFILGIPSILTSVATDKIIHQNAFSNQKIKYLLTGLEGSGVSYYLCKEGDFKYSLPMHSGIKCILTKYILENYSEELHNDQKSENQLEVENITQIFNLELPQSEVENLSEVGL